MTSCLPITAQIPRIKLKFVKSDWIYTLLVCVTSDTGLILEVTFFLQIFATNTCATLFFHRINLNRKKNFFLHKNHPSLSTRVFPQCARQNYLLRLKKEKK